MGLISVFNGSVTQFIRGDAEDEGEGNLCNVLFTLLGRNRGLFRPHTVIPLSKVGEFF